MQGEVRVLSQLSSGRTITLDRRGSGQLLGWISLLSKSSVEYIQASDQCVCLLIPSMGIQEALKSNNAFYDYFDSKVSLSESLFVLDKVFKTLLCPPSDEEAWIRQIVKRTVVQSIHPSDFVSNTKESYFLASDLTLDSGEVLNVGSHLTSHFFDSGFFTGLESSLRVLICPHHLIAPYQSQLDFDKNDRVSSPSDSNLYTIATDSEEVLARIASTEELGFINSEDLEPRQKFPSRSSSNINGQIRACMHNVADLFSIPFSSEVIDRIIQQQLKKRSKVSLELLAILGEVLGLQTRLGKVRPDQFHAVVTPFILLQDSGDSSSSRPILVLESRNSNYTVSDSKLGIIELSLSDIFANGVDIKRVLLFNKTETTKTNRFGWQWFAPLLRKYRWSLLIVFLATFGAQIATLAIPLLMQQIIDKTLSQGNISSLNVLGGALIAIALFQALMQGLRTFVFKDTADRMDLQLGATVIDRLLRLPLPFFDRRPVGELSQRLGEMNSIRNFLTGTAITSVMDMLFSVIYIVVMILYSPLLTVVALSTFPLYAMLVFIVAPLYKSLIRKQAVAQARTQSHVIEVLGAIQTVKAQNIELKSRWKWQDRYQGVVEQGFKAVTVGTISGQIGNFLNTLSSLLLLWVGMIEVIEGNITLGQLIAFRIIAGYVTGPLLRLSNLYQGFQKVSLSFERLGDIINQQPEANANTGQIALPPLSGDVSFDDLCFRFANQGPLTLDHVTLNVEHGQFVGVAGLSGSGKSTLMKLLGRLYEPMSGRILIDAYDIAKTDLGSLRQQVGIVPQESLLFEGSVRENLSLGRPEADTDDIIRAAKVACAHDFIMDLPDGYNTILSEKGSNLSGGQRQRLSIARTLLAEPRMLILDEATSALDYQTEAQVCENLKSELDGRTVFFITHRLGTIRNADKIIMMHQGQVVEEGVHSELLEMKGRYFALYSQQEAGGNQ